jgi:hypothetical protein
VADDAGSAHARRDRRIDVLATVLLALAAVATAWATYQAAHWRSEQALAGNRSTAARVEANRAAGLANRRILVDVETYMQWVDAYSAGNTKLADFYFRRFRPELRPAVAAWIATRPLTNPKAPLTPFDVPEYRSAALATADRLEAKGNVEAAVAQAQVQRADKYTLCVVLFAMTLFFAGISTRLRSSLGQMAILGLGCTVFLGAVAWAATFPVSVQL